MTTSKSELEPLDIGSWKALQTFAFALQNNFNQQSDRIFCPSKSKVWYKKRQKLKWETMIPIIQKKNPVKIKLPKLIWCQIRILICFV